MAELSTADRQRVWRGLMRYWSGVREALSLTKAELQTTINETDTWIDDNQAAYKTSLTYNGLFTAAQLTLIFCVVAAMRVSAAFARRLIGEVD